MKNQLLLCLLVLCGLGILYPMNAQINEVEVNPDGVYFPRYTTTERNATINTPMAGQCIYNTTLDRVECYNGSEWVKASGQPLAFSAFLNSPIDVNNNVDTTLTGFTEVYDPFEIFNPATGTFTAPSTGLYQIGVKLALQWDGLDIENDVAIIRFRKNGSIDFNGFQYTVRRYSAFSNYGEDVEFNTMLDLALGDEITVEVTFITGGPSTRIFGGVASLGTTFSASRL